MVCFILVPNWKFTESELLKCAFLDGLSLIETYHKSHIGTLHIPAYVDFDDQILSALSVQDVL